MKARIIVVFLFVLGSDCLVAGGPPATNRDSSFPRNYFLRTLASGPLEGHNALERLEREHAGSREGAEALLTVLRRIGRDSQKQDVVFRLMRALRLFKQREVSDYLIELLAAPDYRLAMVSLELLEDRDTELPAAAIEALRNRREFRSMYGFRLAVLQAAAAAKSARGIEFLIHVLPELDGQSAVFVIRHLSSVSGQSFGSNKAEWQQWWANVDKQSIEYDGMLESAGEEIEDPEYSSPEFFGIDIRAKRIVFIVDKSTSMSDALEARASQPSLGRGASETRMQKAQRELVGAIRSLPAETQFNILAFDGRVTPWRARLVPADRENKIQALRFVTSIAADGHTAWFDALDAAFRLDGNLESVYFLSDGVPTVGKIISAPEIVRTITDENSFRRISIHTIGLGVSTPAERFLSTLAQENNGVYRSLGTRLPSQAAPSRRQASVATFAPERVIARPMPPIRRVRTMSAKSANRRLKPNEAVLGVAIGGQARAYPINMLTGPDREIINDTLAGRAIAATW